jgi:hypothetical protein
MTFLLKLFGKIKLYDENENNKITKHNNFRSFWSALMVLFRSATGESWQEIMFSIFKDAKCDPLFIPQISKSIDSEDCSSWVAIPYFVSFVCFCSFLVFILT